MVEMGAAEYGLRMMLLLAGCFLKGPTCPTLDDVEPKDGGAIDPDGTVVVTLTEEDESASLESVVAGRSQVSGREVSWTPSNPLTPGSTLTLTLSTCEGDEKNHLTYEVSQGAPVGGASGLEGKGWRIPTSGLLAALGQSELELTATGGARDELDLAFISSPCLDLPTADFSEDPYFSMGPADAAIPIAEFDVGITDFRMSGSFTEGGERMIGVTLAYTFDMRLIAAVFPEFTAGQLCELVRTFSYECNECRDGANFCVDIRDEGLTGDPMQGGPFCR